MATRRRIRKNKEGGDGLKLGGLEKELVEKGVRLDKLNSNHVFSLIVIGVVVAMAYYSISIALSTMDKSEKTMLEVVRASNEISKSVNRLAEIVNTSSGCNIARSNSLSVTKD
jgi:hypothetical protein